MSLCRFTSLISLGTIFASLFTVTASRAECQLGYTVFRDTLYGGAIGAGIGTLYLVATATTKHLPETIGTASLLGVSGGLIVAGVETYNQDCFGTQVGGSSSEHSWSLLPSVFNVAANKKSNDKGVFYGLTFEKALP